MKNLNNAGDVLSQFGHVPNAGQAFNPAQVLAYDGAMNLVRRVVDVPEQPSLNHTSTYSYDARDQLGGETVARPDASLNVARTWNYDAAGNPTAGSNTPATGAATNWTRTFNAANQETTLGWNEATQQFDKTLYAYDGNGNPTLYRGLGAAYDARNRLTAWGRMQSGYRSDGKRAWKATLDNDGLEVSRKYFVYDGDDLLCELDENGRVISTSTWGGNGLLSRAVTAYAQDGTPSTYSVFYGYDERGSVSERVSDNGTSVGVAHVAYDTWGAGSTGDSVGFGGQFGYYTDGETGLVLCTHRFYDPSTQRWMTRDPISYEGGINVYAYVGNNPVNRVDPYGLDWVDVGSNFFGGWGDGLTFGLTKFAREYIGLQLGIGDANIMIDECGNIYRAGLLIGVIHQTLLVHNYSGGAGGLSIKPVGGVEGTQIALGKFVKDRLTKNPTEHLVPWAAELAKALKVPITTFKDWRFADFGLDAAKIAGDAEAKLIIAAMEGADVIHFSLKGVNMQAARAGTGAFKSAEWELHKIIESGWLNKTKFWF